MYLYDHEYEIEVNVLEHINNAMNEFGISTMDGRELSRSWSERYSVGN
jgi:hypothetical protein